MRSLKTILAVLLLGAFPVSHSNAEEMKAFRDCESCPEMIVIPAGEVIIGASDDMVGRMPTERLRIKAAIEKPFALAKTEITRAQYALFIADTGHVSVVGLEKGKMGFGCQYFNGIYGNVATLDWSNPGFIQREDEPVVCISYLDAQGYAAWLSEKSGRAYRIPSSVEFEYAARAGSSAAWPWGNDPKKACEYSNVADHTYSNFLPLNDRFNCQDGFYRTSPAGHFKANAFGVHGMIGNVWEWTADCWRDDLSNTRLDGTALTSSSSEPCEYYTMMGGGSTASPLRARPSVRSREIQHHRTFLAGFRVAAKP